MEKNYSKITFINTNIGNINSYKEIAKKQAYDNKWQYEEIQGDIGLILRLLNGEWDDKEFLKMPPNNKIQPTNDDDIISYVPFVK